ncbi:MAG: AraC family transcriptional regulator [Polyangiaceae bacterium]
MSGGGGGPGARPGFTIGGPVGASSSVSVTVPRAILAAVRARGHDPAPLLAKAGLDESLLADIRARVPAAAVGCLWEEAPRLLGDEAFGLTLGAESTEALGLGVYIMRSCATFGEGLERMWTYYRIFNDVHGVGVETRDPLVVTLALSTKNEPLPAPRHAIEFAFAWLISMVRATTERDVAPVAIAFEHAAPRSNDAHARFFRCPISFGHERTELHFPTEWLGLPHPKYDPHLRELIELEAQAELARVPESASVSKRVRDIVRPLLATDAASLLEIVAKKLRMSARTLQRYLKDEETSFQRELDQLRREVAEHRLRETDDSLATIAHELGFADQSAFHKAFVRWTGRTPGDVRKG